MFSNETNGYNKKEVDSKIRSLNLEISKLKNLKIENDKINLGLVSALEKSKEIQSSSKKLYELKIRKIIILYERLHKNFQILFQLYPQIAQIENIKKAFDEFSQTVEKSFLNINENSNTITSFVSTENDTIRLLLNKMSTYSIKKTESKPVSIKRKDVTKNSSTEKTNILKPICLENKIKLEKNENYECLADKFLESKPTTTDVYSKILNSYQDNDLFPTPNESGFDLKEAINPKQDLAEIMKAFNLD